jgi:hypothetical protein
MLIISILVPESFAPPLSQNFVVLFYIPPSFTKICLRFHYFQFSLIHNHYVVLCSALTYDDLYMIL